MRRLLGRQDQQLLRKGGHVATTRQNHRCMQCGAARGFVRVDDGHAGQSSAAALASGLASSSSLTALDLSASGLHTGGITALCQRLAQSCSVVMLRLDKNGCGDKGACAIAELLRHAHLADISLADNAICSTGAMALSRACAGCKVLISLHKLSRLHLEFARCATSCAGRQFRFLHLLMLGPVL